MLVYDMSFKVWLPLQFAHHSFATRLSLEIMYDLNFARFNYCYHLVSLWIWKHTDYSKGLHSLNKQVHVTLPAPLLPWQGRWCSWYRVSIIKSLHVLLSFASAFAKNTRISSFCWHIHIYVGCVKVQHKVHPRKSGLGKRRGMKFPVESIQHLGAVIA